MNTEDRPILAQEEVKYLIGADESVLDAVLGAFSELDFDLREQDSVLYDWINMDCIESLNWESNDSLLVSTVVWEHPISITEREVTIYPQLTDD